MSFTNGETFIVTQSDTEMNWGGNPRNFRCGLCGHRFIVGDKARWIYTNDTKGAGGNPFVCEECDRDDPKQKWIDLCKEYRKIKEDPRFWKLRHMEGRD